MSVQPRTPPGVLELLPAEQLAFQGMLDTIRRGYERFGFLPVETPVFELADVLLTKTGGETERQVYFVQSTGALEQAKAPELALRFDLTVPLARYVAEHEHQLTFPFRRYQVQRVYRGERAQRGRFREFYQCDIDVVGKDTLSLAHDAELPAIIDGLFSELAFGPFTIKLNNRKLLRGLLSHLDIPLASHAAVLHEVDRLGKRPAAEVVERLAAPPVGLSPDTARALLELLDSSAGSAETLTRLESLASTADGFAQGLLELRRVYEGTLAHGVPAARLQVDLTIARGLDYYTGTVYETFLDEHPRLGSICSGGRYDNLAGHYTSSRLPGVGLSIGATRLFSQLLEHQLVATTRKAVSQVIVLCVEAPLASECAALAAELRRAGFNVESSVAEDKLGKQLKYADRSGIPLAVLWGGREKDSGLAKVKDLRPGGAEHQAARGELPALLRRLLDG